MKSGLLAIAFAFVAVPAAAQVDVGYPPRNSPFRDLEYKHELTIGGPVQFVARMARVNSERNVINPLEPKATRDLGVQSWPIYLTDLGFSLNLTGQRKWHGVVPIVNMGIGLASDLDKKNDKDDFNLGTTFAFSLGSGLRIVPGGRFQMRADAGVWMWQYKYPTTYYALTSDNTTVLGPKVAKNFWKKNLGLTLGASYLLFR